MIMEDDAAAIDLSSIILDVENQNNVKLGDIIYLKTYLKNDCKGLISGEGFGTNKLECLLLQKGCESSLSYKQAELNIYRCLFRIIESNFQNDKFSNKRKLEKNNKINDQSEQINVVYGQEIQLLHLYSKSYLSLDSLVLAKENGCRELKLETKITQNTCFMFQSNTKNSGEPLLYGDILLLKSGIPHLMQWGLGVQKIEPFSEVYATQIPDTLRICSYNENLDNANIISNGDIIIFRNRYFRGYLSIVRQECCTKFITTREINRIDSPIYQKYLELENFRDQKNLEKIFKFSLEKEIRSNSMFLLIKINNEQNNKNSDKQKPQKTYIIQHVLTGAFLFIENEKLSLTYDTLTEKCQFQIKNLQKVDQLIQEGEFYRFLNKNQAVIQCDNNNQIKVLQQHSKSQLDLQLFQFKRGPYEEATSATKIQAFYLGIIEFYTFLQNWGLDEQFNYSYQVAFKQQKQLYDEIKQFEKLIVNINLFLNQSDPKIQKINQYSLCANDVLDLLVLVQQQIDQMTFQENMQQSILVDKTAQRIAKSKFAPTDNLNKSKQFNVIQEIYNLIYLIILDNSQCCDYLINKDEILEFLTSQLFQHKDTIERIIKQAVSKAKPVYHVASKWASKIQPVNEQNLEEQSFIIKIVSLFVSSLQHSSLQCQNLCRKKLLRSNPFKLIKCQILDDSFPIAVFDDSDDSFYEGNSRFCESHQEKYPLSQKNHIYFEFFSKHDIERKFSLYEQYLINVLYLYAKICEKRNIKNINFVKDQVGVSLQFLERLRNIEHNLLFQKIVIELFTSLYFDINPLTKISKFENTCYLRQDLFDFDIKAESGFFFYENIYSKALQKSERFQECQMSSIQTLDNNIEFFNLKLFSKHVITKQRYHLSFIQIFTQETYPKILIQDSNQFQNYQLIAKIQLNFFLSLIKLIKNTLELGYNPLSLNQHIMTILPHIFVALIIQSNHNFFSFEFNNDLNFLKNLETLRTQFKDQIENLWEEFQFIQSKSWITEFLIWSTSICDDIDLIENIFSESVEIYKSVFYLECNLKILYYLTQKSCSQEHLFPNHNVLLFRCLFGTSKVTRLNQDILNYLGLSLKQELHDLKEIKEVEILDDEIELKYFAIINGHNQSEDFLGPQEIKFHLKKTLRFIKKKQQSKRLENSFVIMHQYIKKINSLYDGLKDLDQSYLHSLQNMMRNAGIHLIFIKFLIKPEKVIENEEVENFYRNLLKFWENFLKDNLTNFQLIYPYLEKLLRIILIPQIDSCSLTYHSFCISKIQLCNAESESIKLIQNICKGLDFTNNLIHIRAGKQYLKMLRALTKTNNKPHFNIQINQRQILNILLSDFRILIDPINYFGEIENIQKGKQKQLDVLKYQQLRLHSTALNLVADCCQNYFLGVQEMQRILLFESLINILHQCPYAVKASYLRCVFELYINQTKQHNQMNDTINFSQIKDIFNFILIPDLELMRSIQRRTTFTSSIKISNNDYWKYVIQTIQFLISIIDEFRMMDKKKQPNIKEEVIQVQQYLQQLIKENQRQLIRNKADYINQVIRLVEEYIENDYKFNQQSRLTLFCARMEINFQDLINYVESLKNRDNFEKLKEICNQNNKSYFQKEDLKKMKRSYSQLDTVTINEEWYDFKLRFNADFTSQDQTTSICKRIKEEQGFQELKEQFAKKKLEIVLNKLNEQGLFFQTEDALSEDTQMFILVNQLLNQKESLLQLENLKDFLFQCKQIFHSSPKYLIKLLQTLFEFKKPKQDQFDLSRSSNEKVEYIQYQNIVSESEIDLIALEMLNSQEMKYQLDAMTLLQQLLDFGNEIVQQRLFNVLKSRKKRKYFVQFFKNFFNENIVEQLEIFRLQKTTIYQQLCIKVLQVLQGLCENVHLEFQKFLLIQNEQDSITNNYNFISETTNLLLNFVIDFQVDDYKKWKIYQQGLLSLIEFSTGLQVNKKEITFNQKLFIGFNRLFKLKINDGILTQNKTNIEQETDSHQLLQTFYIYIKLLISLLEGNIKENKDIYKFLLEVIDIQFLLNLTKKIYHFRIYPKKNNIYVDNTCKNPCIKNQCNESFCKFGFKTIEDSLLIEASLNIFIIGFKLVAVSSDDRYDVFKFSTGFYEQKFQENDEGQNSQENELEFEKTFSLSYRPAISEIQYEELNSDDYQENSFDEVDEVKQNQSQSTSISRNDEFFTFFREFIGRTEVVDQQGKIERILFQKPFVCKYITPNIKYHLIYETDRETDEDRIANFVENIDFYHSQMIHYQKMSTFPIMHFGQKHWRKLKDLSYILCVLIVLFFIIWPEETGSDVNFDQSNSNQQNQVIFIINNIITIVQLILNLIIIVFCAVERYPIAMHFSRGVTNSKMIQNLRQESGYKIPEYLMKYYAFIGYLENNFDQKQAQKNPLRKIIILLIVDFDNFYNVIVFGITIIAFFNTYVYAILLLDIIKRSEVLQYIIKAVTQNARNLILFGILGVIGLVQFGFIARLSFSDSFKKEQSYASDSLGYSIAHIINLGLRSGGGVGDSLDDYENPFKDPHKYWSRFFFDLTFFILFNMIFIQMIFGIIVDKFGELRDQRSDLLKDIEGKCFICSLDRNEIDSKTKNGWHFHIYLEHNVYHMLYYLIYIKMKPITECNQLEKYIKDQIENKQSDFFPMQSTLELQEEEKMAK